MLSAETMAAALRIVAAAPFTSTDEAILKLWGMLASEYFWKEPYAGLPIWFPGRMVAIWSPGWKVGEESPTASTMPA